MQLLPEDGAWEFTGRAELEEILADNDLDPDDICLVGSVSMSVRGMREHRDIDFVVRSGKRKQLDGADFDNFVGLVEDKYDSIEISDDDLIDNERYHDLVDGFKVVRPEITFSYKRLRGWEKDEQDLELLERYAEATDDWDWNLYRSDYSKRPHSLHSRALQSLSNDGFVVTMDKGIGLLHRKFPIFGHIIGKLPVYDLTTPLDAIRGRTRTVDSAAVLNRQYSGDRFTAYDVVAHWSAARTDGTGDGQKFDYTTLGLDQSVEDDNDESSILKLSLKHKVLEPAKLAHEVANNTLNITISFGLGRRNNRDTTWLNQSTLNEADREYLKQQHRELMDEVGAHFYSIFWPPAIEHFDEMERVLGEKVTVVDSEEVHIDDIELFTKAVYQAQTDDAPSWAIEFKAEQMTKFDPIIRFLTLEVPNPRIRDGVSREMEMVKNDVRHEFIRHFPDEYYHSILHATDSYEDNRKLKEVVATHRVD